jgi:hypothetical protein
VRSNYFEFLSVFLLQISSVASGQLAKSRTSDWPNLMAAQIEFRLIRRRAAQSRFPKRFIKFAARAMQPVGRSGVRS